MPRQKKEKTSETSPLAQIEAYLNQNKNDHYNFETEHVYTVSSGSLLLDIEMNGGIRQVSLGLQEYLKAAKHLAL